MPWRRLRVGGGRRRGRGDGRHNVARDTDSSGEVGGEDVVDQNDTGDVNVGVEGGDGVVGVDGGAGGVGDVDFRGAVAGMLSLLGVLGADAVRSC